MWKRRQQMNKDMLGEFRRMKKMKLYADEDIENEAVEYLRDEKVNIVSVREQGNQGKPDSFHVGEAFKQKRVIITKNGKDFLPIPFQKMYGLIVLEGNLSNENAFYNTLENIIYDLVPYADNYLSAKITISENNMTVQAIRNGKKVFRKLKFNESIRDWDQWVDE